MSDKIISDITKEFAKKFAEVKDAFILEELEPHFEYDSDNNIKWSQRVRLRLATSDDFRERCRKEKDAVRQLLLDDIESIRDDLFSGRNWRHIMKSQINKRFGVE